MLIVKFEAVCAALGIPLAFIQPSIAEAVGGMEPLPMWGQLGVCGMCGFIIIVLVTKTIPNISRESAAASRAVGESCERGMCAMASEVKGMRDDIQENTQAQFDLLREVVNKK